MTSLRTFFKVNALPLIIVSSLPLYIGGVSAGKSPSKQAPQNPHPNYGQKQQQLPVPRTPARLGPRTQVPRTPSSQSLPPSPVTPLQPLVTSGTSSVPTRPTRPPSPNEETGYLPVPEEYKAHFTPEQWTRKHRTFYFLKDGEWSKKHSEFLDRLDGKAHSHVTPPSGSFSLATPRGSASSSLTKKIVDLSTPLSSNERDQ